MMQKIVEENTRVRASRGLGGSRMRSLALVAAVFLTIVISSCGSNSATIGVTITAVGAPQEGSEQSPVVVVKGQTATFVANVTGGSTTTVYWQVCLPPPFPQTNPPTQPTTCTPIPGVTSPTTTVILTGYGTITQSGTYTSPSSLPQQNPFVVMAVSQVDLTAFAVAYVQIDSGIRVQMYPTSATLPIQDTYTLTATVTGTTNTAVIWSVNGTTGGDAQNGTIVPTGPQTALYTAPASSITATVVATSVADPTESASASISVGSAADPALTSIDPTTASQGSVQQDVYVVGSNFFSTDVVVVNGTVVPTTWISTTLMRATIPSSLLVHAGNVPIQVQGDNGNTSPTQNLSVTTPRPAVVAVAPNSVPATPAGFGVGLTGGFFSLGTTSANFNSFTGPSPGVTASISSSRQMTVNLPVGGLSTAGLYPIVVQNVCQVLGSCGIPLGGSSTTAVNIAVTPPAGTLLTSPTATVGVGSSPSAIAVDEADGYAIVANTGSNSVSILNLNANPPALITNVAVGNMPTGVAVDDGLTAPLHPLALVVNNADNTLSVIDLSTFTVTQTVSLAGLTPSTSLPFSVGINPVTHRAFVADANANSGTVIDLLNPNPQLTPPCTTPPCPLLQLGGNPTAYGTGPTPGISIDPRLNWAVVSGGGGGEGIINLVDLGRSAIQGVDPGRAPLVVAAFVPGGSSGVQGTGVNPETHQVLLTIPSEGNFTTFSMLDQSVGTVPFTNNQVIVNQPGYVAAAVSALPNIGVAVNSNANTAVILDLQNRIVIGNVAVGTQPVAVAVDPSTNQALVVNQVDGTVSVLSLGTVRSSASLGASQAPQITLSSPEVAFSSTNPLALTVTGGGFANGAQVFLDGTAVASVVSNGRQIVATVPAAMLSDARRYAVYVQNPGQSAISNIEDLIVVQPVTVGASPFGVAIDTDCDVAAVTNSGDGTVSIVALTANSAPPGANCVSAGAVGTVGAPIPVGSAPEGVAIAPRIGAAVVANNGSNDASLVDMTEINPPSTIVLCGGGCNTVTAVAMNQDFATAQITDVSGTGTGATGGTSAISVSLSSSGVLTAASGAGAPPLDLAPTADAIDPYIDFLGVTTAGQASAIDIVNIPEDTKTDVTDFLGLGVQVPTGIIFDPVNQVFVVANSLANNVIFVDPNTAIATEAQVGMNPSSLDYDYQTSTLVTANNASKTLSIIDYVCPPSILNTCSGPQVRSILALAGSPQFSIAIDPKLNLAVLVDQANNRVLLIPLP
jgi:DNA-binding beta-propeller fold protein YncE